MTDADMETPDDFDEERSKACLGTLEDRSPRREEEGFLRALGFLGL